MKVPELILKNWQIKLVSLAIAILVWYFTI